MKENPSQMLTAYVRAFEALEAEAVVAFYQLPCTFVRPDGVWIVSDRETALTLAAHRIDQARNSGYARTGVENLRVKCLAAELASLTGVFVRYAAAGAEIARFGFTYVARRQQNAWKIVVAIAHDAVDDEG